MCGIAGFISASVSPDTRRSAVERMNAAMLHRGPDDHGLITDGPATLGMRRLAIFDPAHGHQPMTTPDGRHHIVFNGALYNFRELRAELTSTGRTFRTDCDTEVLLAAYAHWGEKCLARLRGMFAFAVWDSREQTLFLARDPLGIKPLYYSVGANSSTSTGTFLFASELRALIASGHCSDAISPESVNACLAYLAPHAPATIYRDALSLRPGECATLREGRLQIRAYWTFRDATNSAFFPLPSTLNPLPSSDSSRPTASRSEFISELRAQLDDSIRAHTLADVPVGAFLSGGLDSGIIAGLMARQHGAKLKTFSIGFAETAYSEATEAAATAAYLGTEHTALVLSGQQVAADLPRILASFDQPTGDAINTFYASQLARAGGVTVALSGLGGDELFGGYPWFHSTPKLARWLPLWRSLPSALQRPLLAQLRRGRTRRQKLADFLEHATDLHSLAALQRRNFSEVQRTALLSPDLARQFAFSPHPELPHLTAELPLSFDSPASASGSGSNPGADPFSIISAWELRTYMADVLLRDSDVMSMHHSLELRVPFVDRPLLEWLWRQPAHFKDDRSAAPKAILAEAARDVLPPDLLTRRKRGFTLPFPLWMRGALRPFLDETFSESSVARSGFFNTPAVCARWQTFLARDINRDWSRLWSLAVLITFVNRRRSLPL
jgi:asparagine synthase (glutamine-hydrolysing)